MLPFLLVHTLTAARIARSCDVVHAQWTLSAAAAYLGKQTHGCPIAVTLQGSDIFQVTRHPLGAWLTRELLRRCDRITALSQALKQSTGSIGVDPDRIQIIPNGVNTRHFVPPADGDRDRVILYVGTLIERKGLKHLVGAMPAMLQSFPDHRLVLVGEGPEAPHLKQLADELGIAERVRFVGFLPPDQVRGWMQRARVLILPSLEEGMGVVLLEALACGTPVVGSRVDGIQEVITSDVGRLVPPADSAALAEAITSVIGDSQRWAVLSRNARQRAVAHYDWDHIARQFVDMYASMI
jgi:glycosyltransferase involved in cell wall biosynthesis